MSNIVHRPLHVVLLALLVAAAGCGQTGSPAGQPSGAAPAPPAAASAAAQPTTAPAAAKPAGSPVAAKPAVAISNPPSTPEMVDAIDLQGKNVEVVYWHNRPQKDQDLLQAMLDDFSKTNPYGIKA